MIRKSLDWLKQNNHLYNDVDIDEQWFKTYEEGYLNK